MEVKNTLQQCASNQPGRKKLRTSKYKKTQSVVLEWFRLQQGLYTPIKGPISRQKAEEIALKLYTEITLSNGWHDQLKKHAGLAYRTMSGKSKV
jgi:hypothetical protein